MRRRQFLLIGGAAAISAVGVAALWPPATPTDLSIATLRYRLAELENQALSFSGSWNAVQVFTHLKQSVDYSLKGYPQPRSEIFQQVIGQQAFALFARQGHMQHDLAEPIPGAPALNSEGVVAAAIAALNNSLQAFEEHDGELAPHFAFGKLSKSDYAKAHVMHAYDHFSELQVVHT